MISFSLSKLLVLFFLIVLIFGDFPYLVNKVKSSFGNVVKKDRKKGS